MLGALDTVWITDRGSTTLVPDFVLQLGANPTSRGWEELCATHRIRRVVVHPWDWVDPASSAELIVQADVADFVRALAGESFVGTQRDAAFAANLRRAEELVWTTASDVLSEASDELSEAIDKVCGFGFDASRKPTLELVERILDDSADDLSLDHHFALSSLLEELDYAQEVELFGKDAAECALSTETIDKARLDLSDRLCYAFFNDISHDDTGAFRGK